MSNLINPLLNKNIVRLLTIIEQKWDMIEFYSCTIDKDGIRMLRNYHWSYSSELLQNKFISSVNKETGFVEFRRGLITIILT